ncbi:DNA translocase FtsK [Aciduricibacillus chroicocephali]|uniref:DNA translocase FtsK n=1 Tax=Aciduricibacillus chroicocephali TaxID=3054939 RepID=A0ABY9KSC9_9BACI|nr:DNA translocase FtsK [Bacillaceae bacterium 44XB]
MSNLWDKWKSKIKNVFTYEEEIIEEEIEYIENRLEQKAVQSSAPIKKEPAPRYNHNEAATKSTIRMTYQYPENSPYKPLPDPRADELPRRGERHSLIEKETIQEEPIYQVTAKRRRNTRQIESQVEHFDPIDSFERTERHERPDRAERPRKAYESVGKVEVGKRPFQPTEVPSPIYGFHPRNEGDGLPAFMHPDNTKTGLNEERNIEQLSKLPLEDQPLDAESHEYEKMNPIHSSLNKVNDKLEQEMAVDPVVEIPSSIEEERPSVISEQRRERKALRTESKVEQETAATEAPFNVIMNDTDKIHQAHKQYKREQEVKERFKQIVSEANQIPENMSKKGPEINFEKETARNPLPFHLLNDPEPTNDEDSIWVEEQKNLLEQTLAHFNVKGVVVNATQGPSVTKFEVQIELGVKVSKVKNLSDDLKLSLAAKDIRIEAPIPGKNTIGIEVPNPHAQMVGLQQIFESSEFQGSESPLSIGLGLNIEGKPIVTNIQKMPHGLIAGATGSGKSVCINTILISLIYKASHEDVRLLLIDPKMVELAPYNGVPHLVSPVITDVKAATAALKWAVAEMEDRYERFVKEGVRDISRYNDKVLKQGRPSDKMPFLVIVIDELADLMMVSPQDVEDSICRIAQKARACGIHLLLATQRPSVDVITGLIKANIPTRIAFSVSSQVDSRTIIDTNGAERLLGKGDMLFLENGSGSTVRIQGAFVSDDEIERVANYARNEAPANYLFEQEELLARVQVDEESDELLEEAIEFVIEQNNASTSMLQRHFRIGYNRAARLIDTLEQRGIINQQNGSKPRDVLVSKAQLEEMMK